MGYRKCIFLSLLFDRYSSGMHNLIKSMLEVSALQRPFIDGVLFQIDSLLPVVQDRV